MSDRQEKQPLVPTEPDPLDAALTPTGRRGRIPGHDTPVATWARDAKLRVLVRRFPWVAATLGVGGRGH